MSSPFTLLFFRIELMYIWYINIILSFYTYKHFKCVLKTKLIKYKSRHLGLIVVWDMCLYVVLLLVTKLEGTLTAFHELFPVNREYVEIVTYLFAIRIYDSVNNAKLLKFIGQFDLGSSITTFDPIYTINGNLWNFTSYTKLILTSKYLTCSCVALICTVNLIFITYTVS